MDNNPLENQKLVNGKHYPLWQQFVDKKDQHIGSNLIGEGVSTKIIDIKLEPNGDDSAMFNVIGEDFTCGFDVAYGGIDGSRCKDGVLAFSGYAGHQWEIKSK